METQMLSESLDSALLDQKKTKNAKLSQSSNSVAAAPCQSEPVFAEGPLRPPNRIPLKKKGFFFFFLIIIGTVGGGNSGICLSLRHICCL